MHKPRQLVQSGRERPLHPAHLQVQVQERWGQASHGSPLVEAPDQAPQARKQRHRVGQSPCTRVEHACAWVVRNNENKPRERCSDAPMMPRSDISSSVTRPSSHVTPGALRQHHMGSDPFQRSQPIWASAFEKRVANKSSISQSPPESAPAEIQGEGAEARTPTRQRRTNICPRAGATGHGAASYGEGGCGGWGVGNEVVCTVVLVCVPASMWKEGQASRARRY